MLFPLYFFPLVFRWLSFTFLKIINQKNESQPELKGIMREEAKGISLFLRLG